MITTFPRIRGNEDPIVLVAGFTGWGRDEFGGFLYWGGTSDIQEELKQQGYPTFTAGIGPYSSNWDRACELFAIIKGGTVDYGEVHSKRFGHARYGRTFPGLYPQWSKENKIHIIGHSMGGQTA
ncbi:MAG TPA: lipase, partial [Paenibacillaceae bacterium]|nr:lipase [Paenibacillaceae bacterium]